jgi:CTP synthase
MCDVEVEAVASCVDAPSIYEIPKVLHSEGLDAYVVRRLGLQFRDVDWTVWGDLLDRVHHPSETVRIALVGKYVDLPDAYLSVTEALRAGGFAHRAKVEVVWVPSDDCITPAGAAAALADVQGVLIPGGFGVRGIEGKVGAISYARSNRIPLLGLCLGLQCMVIEAARELAGLPDANSTEFAPDSPDPVISTMAEQLDVVAGERDMGGTMRLGAYPAALVPGSLTAEIYGRTEVSERHRHRYEVNNAYRDTLESAGLHISGTSPDGSLVEFVELDRELHPFAVATQAHPELKSRPTRPHPLFAAFTGAALDYLRSERLPIDGDDEGDGDDGVGDSPATDSPAGDSPTSGVANGGTTVSASAASR